MSKQPSLTFRLCVYLLAGQLTVFFATGLFLNLRDLIPGYRGEDASPNDLSTDLAFDVVADSLTRAADGSLAITPSRELRALADRVPTFRYAAFDPATRAALPGSSAELVAMLAFGESVTPTAISFRAGSAKSAPVGALTAWRTPVGRIPIAVYGYVFEWPAVAHYVLRDFLHALKDTAPTLAIALCIGWLTLRRGLEPLRRAARQTRAMDAARLDQRIALSGIPSEIAPFVSTINGLLERLEGSVARQKRFLANAAHELRTPVAILTERLDEADSLADLPELQRDAHRIRILDAHRIRILMEQLLSTARLDERREDLARDIDLNAVAQSVVDDHAFVAIKAGRSLEIESSDAPILAHGDKRALESVLANLLDNALRAEPPGGAVILRVGPGAVVAVEDHGEGVDPDHREKVFEPFWRKDDTPPGAGLGLAIVKELVELHGGAIHVRETPGGGATFEIDLRAAPAPPREDARGS